MRYVILPADDGRISTCWAYTEVEHVEDDGSTWLETNKPDDSGYALADFPDGIDELEIVRGYAWDGAGVVESAEALAATLEEESAAETEREEALAMADLQAALPDAVADLSEQVSTNSVDSSDLAEAVAELSQLVSDLMGENDG